MGGRATVGWPGRRLHSWNTKSTTAHQGHKSAEPGSATFVIDQNEGRVKRVEKTRVHWLGFVHAASWRSWCSLVALVFQIESRGRWPPRVRPANLTATPPTRQPAPKTQ